VKGATLHKRHDNLNSKLDQERPAQELLVLQVCIKGWIMVSGLLSLTNELVIGSPTREVTHVTSYILLSQFFTSESLS
jgi:hypothetical protein